MSQEQPEITFKFKGATITIEPRYRPGHVLTELDAALINRAWLTNARAAFAETANVLAEANTSPEEVAREFINFLRKWKYEPQRASVPRDPVVVKAKEIAREEVRTALHEAGGTIKANGQERFDAACLKHFENNRERLIAQAQELLEITGEV